MELARLKLKDERDFYKKVAIVMENVKSQILLQVVYVHGTEEQGNFLCVTILEKSNSPDFDRLCNHVSKIQCLTQSRTKGCRHKKKVLYR